jgi:DNA-binding transcriptional regulator YiaG
MDREEFVRERRRLKVSQVELADALGVTVVTVRGAEVGAATIDETWVETVRAIAARRLEPVANGVGADG